VNITAELVPNAETTSPAEAVAVHPIVKLSFKPSSEGVQGYDMILELQFEQAESVQFRPVIVVPAQLTKT